MTHVHNQPPGKWFQAGHAMLFALLTVAFLAIAQNSAFSPFIRSTCMCIAFELALFTATITYFSIGGPD